MVVLTHRRGELTTIRRGDSPDLVMSTSLEMDGLQRHVTSHRRIIQAISKKVGWRVGRLGPGELFIIGSLFSFATLVQAIDLVYDWSISLGEEAAEHVCDLFAAWGACELQLPKLHV
jgi:hypothetical protein